MNIKITFQDICDWQFRITSARDAMLLSKEEDLPIMSAFFRAF